MNNDTNKKLILGNLKQKVWLIGLYALISFLCRPMMQLMAYENTKRYSTPAMAISTMEAFFLPDIFTDLIPTALGCIAITFVFFSYLFSKKKVDLYHSIPVNRKNLFFVNYVSGLIVYLIGLISEYILCVIIAIPNHYMTATAFKNLLVGIICNLVHFLYGYSVLVCAVMLTGNIIVSIAGASVIAAFVPVITMLIKYFEKYFYVTYTECSGLSESIMSRLYWTSPVLSYSTQIARLNNSSIDFCYNDVFEIFPQLIAPVIVTAGFVILAYFLYMKRQSEVAGKSLAFKKTEPYLRIPISVICGLIGAWFMCVNVNSFKSVWIWFGLILGVTISHCILECIFDESFKAVFSHKIQLSAALLATAVIVGVFFTDITNYDKYIPNRENIKKASVYFQEIDNNVLGVTLSEDKENPGCFVSQCDGGMVYTFSNSFDNDILIDKICAISQIGVSYVDSMIADKYASSEDDGYYAYKETAYTAYEDMVVGGAYKDGNIKDITDNVSYEEALSWLNEQGIYERETESEERKVDVSILYELNNGKQVMRTYYIPLSQIKSAMNDVYKTDEYNKIHFDIYDGYEKGAICKVEVYDVFENRVFSLTDKQKDEFMSVYLSELKKVDISTIEQLPVGRICPFYKTASVYDESYSGYYIYSNFTKTLELINSYGINLKSFDTCINAEDITSIAINPYNVFVNENNDSVYCQEIILSAERDGDMIKELAPLLVNTSNMWSNEMLINSNLKSEDNGMDITVTSNTQNGIQRTYNVVLKDGKIPESIKKAITIQIWADNQY